MDEEEHSRLSVMIDGEDFAFYTNWIVHLSALIVSSEKIPRKTARVNVI